MKKLESTIGIIGGSGLYELPGLQVIEEIELDTPFGQPSDRLIRGEMSGRQVFFLPRHGKGHRIAPHEINHQANLYALRSVGVRWLICVTAVGSLREKYHPRDVLIPDQLFDRTSRREHHTFFGSGIIGHVSFADPYSTNLRQVLLEACREIDQPIHDGGTYACMDGPAFSTRAESRVNRQLGFDVIGMTNLPEAKLAREAEIACATLALITDYDAWKEEEEAVSASSVGTHLQANVATAKKILTAVLPKIPLTPDWPEHFSLDHAIQTPREFWPEETHRKLSIILERFAS